jgi:DNA-binding GntR family transcriptional regulator
MAADGGLSIDGGGVDAVHSRVRRAILHGELPSGEEVSQVQLARDLGISRTPLREALRMLQREGLIEARPNRSVRVAGFSAEDAESLYVARITLEAVAIRISIPLMQPEDLAGLEGHLAQMDHFAAQRDYERWEVPHRAFHAALVAHSGARMTAMLAQLSDHAERYRRKYTLEVARAWLAGVAEHRAIADACKERDPDAGAARLAEHLAHVATGVTGVIEPGYDSSALRTAVAVASAPLGASGPALPP